MAPAAAVLRAAPKRFQALVHGAGPTGCLAALARSGRLAGHPARPLSAQQLKGRSRAYAFNHSSQRLLGRLGLWGALESLMVPFRHLLLRDQAIASDVTFTLADLPAAARRGGGDAVGWIALHAPLMAVLLEQLSAHPSISLRLQDDAPSPGAIRLVLIWWWPPMVPPRPTARTWASASGSGSIAKAASLPRWSCAAPVTTRPGSCSVRMGPLPCCLWGRKRFNWCGVPPPTAAASSKAWPRGVSGSAGRGSP